MRSFLENRDRFGKAPSGIEHVGILKKAVDETQFFNSGLRNNQRIHNARHVKFEEGPTSPREDSIQNVSSRKSERIQGLQKSNFDETSFSNGTTIRTVGFTNNESIQTPQMKFRGDSFPRLLYSDREGSKLLEMTDSDETEDCATTATETIRISRALRDRKEGKCLKLKYGVVQRQKQKKALARLFIEESHHNFGTTIKTFGESMIFQEEQKENEFLKREEKEIQRQERKKAVSRLFMVDEGNSSTTIKTIGFLEDLREQIESDSLGEEEEFQRRERKISRSWLFTKEGEENFDTTNRSVDDTQFWREEEDREFSIREDDEFQTQEYDEVESQQFMEEESSESIMITIGNPRASELLKRMKGQNQPLERRNGTLRQFMMESERAYGTTIKTIGNTGEENNQKKESEEIRSPETVESPKFAKKQEESEPSRRVKEENLRPERKGGILRLFMMESEKAYGTTIRTIGNSGRSRNQNDERRSSMMVGCVAEAVADTTPDDSPTKNPPGSLPTKKPRRPDQLLYTPRQRALESPNSSEKVGNSPPNFRREEKSVSPLALPSRSPMKALARIEKKSPLTKKEASPQRVIQRLIQHISSPQNGDRKEPRDLMKEKDLKKLVETPSTSFDCCEHEEIRPVKKFSKPTLSKEFCEKVLGTLSSEPITARTRRSLKQEQKSEEKKEDEPLKFIDSHFHPDFIYNKIPGKKQNDGLDEWVQKYPNAFPDSFEGAIANFIDVPRYLEQNKNSTIKWIQREIQSELYVGATYGIHPHFAECKTEAFDFIESILEENDWRRWKLVGVGECGIDLYKSEASLQAQRYTFQQQISLALKYEKTLVVHCRSADKYKAAEDECIKAIITEMDKKGGSRELHIHRHCYTEDWPTAQKWIANFPNVVFGFTPGIENFSENQLEAVRRLPMNKIILETDAPYFKPPIFADASPAKIALPGMAVSSAIAIAEAREMELEDVLRQCYKNTRRVYRLDEDS